jgi:23S rRNA pseudouridine1911/1915/1917 synthase
MVASTSSTTEESKATASPPRLHTVIDREVYKVFIKPQGLPTMGQKGLKVFNHPDLRLYGPGKRKAIPCHRLDCATGGLLICSKTKIAEIMIKQCFSFKWVQKKYLAIVLGKLEPQEGEITFPIKGKKAITKYKVLSNTPSLKCGWISTVELQPVTGRKHQLRKHLKQLGHSIVGKFVRIMIAFI